MYSITDLILLGLFNNSKTEFVIFFESILEACVDSIKFMWVKIRPCGEEMVFCMEVESEDDLNSFFDKTDQGENEDGIWKFTFTIKKAGEK